MQLSIITDDYEQVASSIESLIKEAQLQLQCNWQPVEKLNNKTLKQVFTDRTDDNLTLIVESDDTSGKNGVKAGLCAVAYNDKNKPTITKVSLDWHKLQRRIVTAGRKSELLLQACKLTAESKVIDATAGFGHDSLILASGGASVTMIEQNPLMALLLMLERERMSQEKNWQSLMARLDIKFANSLDWLLNFSSIKEDLKADVIYLDPMFPNDSYEGAKVGKGMQVLHSLASPPSMEEEKQLLDRAKSVLADGGRVVVKRPKNAPYLANIKADESWANDVVRFDGYFLC